MPGTARAQASGRAASLVLQAPSALAMKVQEAELVFEPAQRSFAVRAHFELSAAPGAAVSGELALPEYACDEQSEFDERCDPTSTRLAQPEVRVRDQPVRARHVASKSSPGGVSGAWRVPLQAAGGESVPIDIAYRVPAGESAEGGFSANYLLRGLSGLNKPIGRATFKFVIPAYACLVVEPRGIARKSRRVVARDDGPWLELVYEAYVFTPKHDLALYFEPCVVPRDTELRGCSASAELARFFYPPAADDEGEAIDEPALRAKLASLSDAELARCRDAVFDAYAGYFQASELTRLPHSAESARHYTAPLLTAADWNWVHFVDQRLQERKARAVLPVRENNPASSARRGWGCASVVAADGGEWWPACAALAALRLCRSRRRRMRHRGDT